MKKSLRIIRYLDHKLAGGSINQRGNDYELCYAIYQIMKLADKFPAQATLVSLSAQVSAFVDDFYVKNLVAIALLKTSHGQGL
jgi:hypothetical protein